MNASQLLDATAVSASLAIGDNMRTKNIAPHPSQTQNLFYICTSSLKQQNKVYLLEFTEETNQLTKISEQALVGVPSQIIPNQSNEQQFYALYSEFQGINENVSFALYNLNNPNQQTENNNPIFKMNNGRKIHSLKQIKNQPKLIVCDELSVNIFDTQKLEFAQTFQDLSFRSVKCELDPCHENLLLIVTEDSNLLINDIRENQIKYKIPGAHQLNVLDVDFNDNKQYYFQTCGEDRLVKFWDMRKQDMPIKVLDDLLNIPLSTKFNKYHDQLIVTSFDDGSIALYRMNSISSAPIENQLNQILNTKDDDGLIKLFDEQEDSVYSVCWSQASAWILASISYNGNVQINMVPASDKYRILL